MRSIKGMGQGRLINTRASVWVSFSMEGVNDMFKNCVFKVSVNTQKWFKASLIRAVKTMAQTAVAVIGTGAET